MKIWASLPFLGAGLTVVVLGVAAAAFAAGPAPAPDPGCGGIVTENIILTQDIKGCQGNGLTIGASGLTVDLNGHTIEGDGERGNCPTDEPCDVGVLAGGHSNITIKDGRITDFSTGVLLRGGTRERLAHLTSDGNLADGLRLTSSNSLVTHSTFSSNGDSRAGSGISLDQARESRVAQSTVARNDGVGVRMSGPSAESVVGNDISENRFGGVILQGSDSRVSRNQLVCVGIGIKFSGKRDRVTDNNVVRPARGHGCSYGVSLEGGHENLVLGNQVADTIRAAIRLRGHGPGSTGENVVQDNVLFEPGRNGLVVEPSVFSTLISQNVARRARHDGLKVENPTTKVVGNLAVSNGGTGIFAVSGVKDGGGNSAHGNGAELQCRNVRCG